ncbi:hypothetical protein CEE37_07875 [candidate division LCP-89 bacterium B3_LCP]|uniref:Sodium:phosphate symporter n=1 Tax=candidate division LCP-89 bacterium B3_LCP TaxID=2012998 RepID=A0A532UZ52_UNCL8|nr:MAG: hypothetical protein CEE37_07875 [candidate division LCP-89 bacterium B3_LCP]
MDTTDSTKDRYATIARIFLLLGLVYLFLVSISLMGAGLKALGLDFTQRVIASTSSAFVGLFIGILVTSIVQSSSTTTSIVVGLVGSGMMSLDQAIPIIMGANIGTSVTNILVSMGHLRVKPELERAFGAAVVHDIFNVFTVILILPLQFKFDILGKSANFMAQIFEKSGGLQFVSPLKLIVKPAVELLEGVLAGNAWFVIALSLVILFLSLRYIVKVMKSLVMTRITVFFNKVIFRSPLVGIFFGMLFTAVVQSSSVTTSLIVPLAGAGLVTLEQVFPFTLGANIGTTITALMASLVTQNPAAVAVAFAHLLFNIFGIIIFLPLKIIPITVAKKFAALAVKNRAYPILFILLVFLIIPLLLIQIMR